MLLLTTLAVNPVRVVPENVAVDHVVVISAAALASAVTIIEKSATVAGDEVQETDKPVMATPVEVLATGAETTAIPLAMFEAKRTPFTVNESFPGSVVFPVIVDAENVLP